MENRELNKENYQKVLYALSWIVLAIAVVLIILRITDIFDFGISLIVACTFVSRIMQDICLWKTKPKMYTWMIALDSFMIGLTLMDIIDRLLGLLFQ